MLSLLFVLALCVGGGCTRRLLQAALGIAVIGVLGWSAAQPYLMVSSVFPSTAGRAGVALCVWAVIMVLSALFPRVEEHLKRS